MLQRHWEEGTAHFDSSSSDYTTVKEYAQNLSLLERFSQYCLSMLKLSSLLCFSDLPSHSHVMDIDHGTGASDYQNYTSMERLRDDRFQEGCSYSLTFLGVGGSSSDPDWWFGEDNQADEQQMSPKEVSLASGEKLQDEIDIQKPNKNSLTDGTGMEPSALIDKFLEEHFSHPQTLKLPELLLTETREHEVLKTPEKQDVQGAIDSYYCLH